MKTIKIKGIDAFIIPNNAPTVMMYFEAFRDKKLREMQTLCELNNVVFNEKTEHNVEIWLTGENTVGSDNLRCHPFTVTDDNGSRHSGHIYLDAFPESLFRGHIEGDTVSLKIPGTVDNARSETEDVIFDMEVTFKQQEYRYRNHGRFEEVLNSVCRR